jgi:hypothetical protein
MTLSKVRLRNAIDLGIQILLNYSLRFLKLVSLLGEFIVAELNFGSR